ncbi:MAG: phospholipase [Legionellaceae bacterium]|nr:phospholipase [Legionellaceae bacterium]HAF87820.1 phospholipase [Legionellales bacterium]HCA89124.1 phospholipase [Legionellales bacterium]
MMKYTTLFLLLLSLGSHATWAAHDASAAKPTALEQEIKEKNKVEKYPRLINLYLPNYILPFYYTGHPYQAIYLNETPNNQRIMNEELKAQLSFLVPIVPHIIKQQPFSLNFAYTQLMYWQVYAKSQYFRETNYEPELFVENYFNAHVSGQFGINHTSNGRGGLYERSWNRAYAQAKLSGTHWLLNIRGWVPVARSASSDLHNPDIYHYLGYERTILSWKFHQLNTSFEVQNLASGFKRGYQKLTFSYPVTSSFSVYAQLFNGFGQSLIEYNHATTSAGIGISLNDWL